MSLADDLTAPDDVQRARADALQDEVGRLRRELKDTVARADTLERVAEYAGRSLRPPKWLTRRPKKHSKNATLVSVLSDCHFDENVSAAEIGGRNAYDRDIAEMRLETYFAQVVRLSRDYLTGMTYDGVVLMLGGDLISGDIHEELSETNEAQTLDTVLHWSERIAAGVGSLADEFGRVHVPVVVGNHGRRSRKPRAKGRARDNYDWLIGQLLARHFHDDDRVTFDIPDGTDCLVKIHDTTLLLTHGDQVSGGGGIGGVWPPIMRMVAKKRARHHFDAVVMGHWHSLIMAPTAGVVVNGCFPSGSKVLTSTGYTPIQAIRMGDAVVSRDGSEQKVTHVFRREAENGLVGLKVGGLPHVLHATPNHAIWAMKGNSPKSAVTPARRHLVDSRTSAPQWIPIGFLSPGDYVHVPFPKGTEAPVDAETAWAYGLYIAEGHATLDGGSSGRHNRLHLTMHQRERATVERWAAWFDATFGVTPRVGHRAGRNTTDLVVSPGRETVAWFRDTFGHGAANKHAPDGALFWAAELKVALLDGWVEGDGHSAAQDDCRPTVSATTISERLAWEMFYMAPASGVWPTLARLGAGGPRKNDSYTVHLNVGQNVAVVGDEAFYRIIERFETGEAVPVFDLEVSGEHTYVVEGVGVHNSLKGEDEYAAVMNFAPERAQQALFTVAPEHGVTFSCPVFCDDPVREGWG